MKKILTIICVLFAGYIQAQQITYTPMTAAGYRFKYFIADSGHTIPFKDTALNRGSTQPGSLVCFTGDSSVYWWNGARWRPIGSNVTTGTVTSGIDSATFYNGNLCFWTEGASECFDLTAYFCNSELNHDSTRILFYTCTGDLIDSVFLPIAYIDVDYPITKRQVGDTTYIGIDALQGQNGLLFGGVVSHDTLYTYDVTAAIYSINGVQYNSSSGSVTLDPSDDDFDRQDIIALDTNGNIISITGTPGADPLLPQIDPLSQVFLTSVYVKAASIAPDNITREIVYDENVENWTRTVTAGFIINPDNTTNPFHLLKSLDVGSWAPTTKGLLFTNSAGVIPPGTYSLLKLFINLKAPLASTANLVIGFYNGATLVGAITLGAAHGFVKGTAGVYQNVTVPIPTSPFTRFQISFTGAGSGAYIDYVQLQGGIANGASPYITNVFRKTATDSVFQVINGANIFAYRDSLNLQQVTNVGNVTTRSIYVDSLIAISDASIRNMKVGRGITSRGGDSVNVAIGRLVLNANTTGYWNTAVGDSALMSNTTGRTNVAMGQRALKSNTTGLGNVALGIGVMAANTTGFNNIAIGPSVLAANVNGGSNIALGSGALGANVSGNSNVAIGVSTLLAATSVSSSVAIGLQALQSTITGGFNVAVGNGTLASTTTPNNTAIGVGAGGGNTVGINNIFLGRFAGTQNTTDSFRIYINSKTRIGTLTGDTNYSPIYVIQADSLANQIIKLNGVLKIRHGAGAGKVLTSDANGYASWQTSTGGGGTTVYNETVTGSTSSTITLSQTYISGTIRLYKNGVRITDFTEATGTTITLGSARLAGDIFIIDFNY